MQNSWRRRRWTGRAAGEMEASLRPFVGSNQHNSRERRRRKRTVWKEREAGQG